MSQPRPVSQIVAGTPQTDGAGVRLVRVLGHANTQDFDPFLMLDAFDSDDPDDYVRGFPWHPHRGIETVTYLIAGDIEHGDSLGNGGHILDGGCQWMTAGSGILHQEMPQAAPRMLGLQLWVNLPRKDKFAPPEYRDLTAALVPKVRDGAATVAVIAGRHGEAEGATQGDYVRVLMLDVALDAGGDWQLPVDPAATVFAYLIDGSAAFGPERKDVPRRRAVLFGEGDQITVRAGGDGVRLVLCAGHPLREPIAWGGPIVMNTREELNQAFAEIQDGTFIR
jgi:quercetin 2,3-dioxygenase